MAFCWLPPGKLADRLAQRGEADAQFPHRIRREAPLEGAADEPARRDPPWNRGRDVLLDRQGPEDARHGAVLGHEGKAQRDGVRGLGDGHWPARDLDPPALGGR